MHPYQRDTLVGIRYLRRVFDAPIVTDCDISIAVFQPVTGETVLSQTGIFKEHPQVRVLKSCLDILISILKIRNDAVGLPAVILGAERQPSYLSIRPLKVRNIFLVESGC